MYETQPTHSLVTFTVGLQPMIDFPVKLSAVGSAIIGDFPKSVQWAWSNINSIAFREPPESLILIVAYNAIQIQTLGFDSWTDQQDRIIEMTRKALVATGVRTVQHATLRCKGYFDVKMRHSEIVDAAFGSYLTHRQDLAPVMSNADDAVVKLYGSEGAAKIELSLVPQTAEQAKDDFFASPNVEAFDDPKARINATADFRSRIERDCLNVDCAVIRKEVSVEEAIGFMRTSATLADRIAERAVNHLLSLPSRK